MGFEGESTRTVLKGMSLLQKDAVYRYVVRKRELVSQKRSLSWSCDGWVALDLVQYAS